MHLSREDLPARGVRNTCSDCRHVSRPLSGDECIVPKQVTLPFLDQTTSSAKAERSPVEEGMECLSYGKFSGCKQADSLDRVAKNPMIDQSRSAVSETLHAR